MFRGLTFFLITQYLLDIKVIKDRLFLNICEKMILLDRNSNRKIFSLY